MSAPPTLGRGDDAQLMAQIALSDRGAFEALYHRYEDRARRVARSVCRDRDRAEEAVQDAFAAVWRGRGSYEPRRGIVAGWLLSLVRYRAVDVARENTRHEARRAPGEGAELQGTRGEASEVVVAKDQAADLESALARLPALQREVVMLAYYGELSHAEIATRLRLPPGTVKGRMRLGMQKLRTDNTRHPAD